MIFVLYKKYLEPPIAIVETQPEETVAQLLKEADDDRERHRAKVKDDVVSMQSKTPPITAEMLAKALPDDGKLMLGVRLFPLIFNMIPDLAGKIIGRLLELDNSELLHLLQSRESLKAKVQQRCSFFHFSLVFLRAKAATAVARLSHRILSVHPSVRLSSHLWISQKRCELESPNIRHQLRGPQVNDCPTKCWRLCLHTIRSIRDVFMENVLFTDIAEKRSLGLIP